MLVDTHALLWLIYEPQRLSQKAQALLTNDKTQPYLSVASLWEIAIKVTLKKLELGSSFAGFMSKYVQRSDLQLVAIEPSHVATYSELAFFHRDPFDRMIIAQALSEGFPVLSADPNFSKYPVEVLW